MDNPDPRISKLLLAYAGLGATLNLADAARTYGTPRAIALFALSTGVPAFGEVLVTGPFGLLRHRTKPRIRGVPLSILLLWYNVIRGAHATTEKALDSTPLGKGRRREVLPLGTALVAASLDLVMDPFGLEARPLGVEGRRSLRPGGRGQQWAARRAGPQLLGLAGFGHGRRARLHAAISGGPFSGGPFSGGSLREPVADSFAAAVLSGPVRCGRYKEASRAPALLGVVSGRGVLRPEGEKLSGAPVILDVDPGHDDAVALMMACGAPGLDLRAVTTVAGNVELEKTTYNALRVLSLVGNTDVPVAAGARNDR